MAVLCVLGMYVVVVVVTALVQSRHKKRPSVMASDHMVLRTIIQEALDDSARREMAEMAAKDLGTLILIEKAYYKMVNRGL